MRGEYKIGLAMVCVIVTFETGGAEIQRRIWPIWLVDTRRRFYCVASAGVQGAA